jgi:hypothetical protein
MAQINRRQGGAGWFGYATRPGALNWWVWTRIYMVSKKILQVGSPLLLEAEPFLPKSWLPNSTSAGIHGVKNGSNLRAIARIEYLSLIARISGHVRRREALIDCTRRAPPDSLPPFNLTCHGWVKLRRQMLHSSYARMMTPPFNFFRAEPLKPVHGSFLAVIGTTHRAVPRKTSKKGSDTAQYLR